MDIGTIQDLYLAGAFYWTNHILVRLLQYGITESDVESALMSGENIEEYQQDYPYPSCLVLGAAEKNKKLHIVCGIGDSKLWLITAYHPGYDKWSPDFKTRKG
ncbi:MAG: DUF4258 domain-containing protein [Oscillospiraceae bacterium]|nr:DUF4258 domain-containing protein [Oscillospiraceae bacterium]